MTFRISDLRQEPAFFDAVADRIWRAWWKPNGYSFEHITRGLAETMKGERIPFAIGAHDGGFYMRQGWVPIEEDVGEHRQTVYVMDAVAAS